MKKGLRLPVLFREINTPEARWDHHDASLLCRKSKRIELILEG